MKLQFGATCHISLYKRDDHSRKFVPVVVRHKARGCVIIGEPRSLTVGNGRNPDIIIYIEPYQTHSLQVDREVAYININGAFLADV